jgi:hypothetical protein
MTHYSLDQFGVIRLGHMVIKQDESDPDYVVYAQWLLAGGTLIEIIAQPEKPPLTEYKNTAKQKIAAMADAFIEKITSTVGIPKAEVTNFESKAAEALAYKYDQKPIPPWSAIITESADTEETVDELCTAIVERVNQRNWVNGKITAARRMAGWAIDEAQTHDAVDAAVNDALQKAKQTFAGFKL